MDIIHGNHTQLVNIGSVHMIAAEKGVFSLLEAAFAVYSTTDVKQQLFESHHSKFMQVMGGCIPQAVL